MGEFFGGPAMETSKQERYPWEDEYSLSEKKDARAEIKGVIKKNPYICEALTDLWKFDRKVTFKHSMEVAKAALIIAEKIHLSPEEKELIVASSLMHDVGKISVDEIILNKPGKLTQEEIEKIREHVRESFNYSKERGAMDVAEVVIRHHQHKRYPRNPENERRLKDNVIYLDQDRREGERRAEKPQFDRLGRILAIIDIFESMSGNSERPYSKKREILPKRKEELEAFDSPEEKEIIAILQERERQTVFEKAA